MSEMSFIYVHRASPETIFTCLTTPEHLAHFWGPRGSHAPAQDIRIDLRPGGRFDAVIINDTDGSWYDMHAVYLEISEPERLVWREQIGPDQHMTTTISLRDIGEGQTEVRTHVADLPDALATERGQAGFRSSLERFAEYVLSSQDLPTAQSGK